MLKLFILRHAQAESGFDKNDHERMLTRHGMGQTNIILPHIPTIDLALCSSAIRTKMTLDGLQDKIQKTLYQDALYNAPAGDLLNAIQKCGTEKTVMIIAHNPGIHQLAVMLSRDEDSEKYNQLRYGYAPATLSILECPIKKWEDIQPEGNSLIDLIIPN